MIYFIFLWIPKSFNTYTINLFVGREAPYLSTVRERERESESSRECTCTEGNLAELCQGLPLAPKSSASSSSKHSLSSAPAIGLSQSSQHRCCCFYAVKHIGCVVHASAAAVVCRGPGGTTLLYVCIYTYYISRAPKTSLGQSCIKVKDTDLDQEYRLLILYLFLL